MKKRFLLVAAVAALCFLGGCQRAPADRTIRSVVTSDTILSGMASSLLPSGRFRVVAILPPGQCPGHYDVKLSDIEKMKRAALVVSFKGMPFMDRTAAEDKTWLSVDMAGRNWMAPGSYIYGTGVLAYELAKRFPEDKGEIEKRRAKVIGDVGRQAHALEERLRAAGLSGRAVLVSSMQREPVEWMGFHVAGEYGRQEALSAKEVARLIAVGKEKHVIMVIDNLQSGPDAGKSIAATLGVPHVVLTNFPSEAGYRATLEENVAAVLAAAKKQ